MTCKEFFERTKIDLDDLKGAVVLTVKPLMGKNDVIGSKMLKCLEFIAKRLKEEGYKIDSYDWEWKGDAIFWYYIKNKNLSEKYKHFGPPVKEIEHLKKFRERYKGKRLKKQGSRVYIELKRKSPYVMDFMKTLLKNSYIREKIRSIRLLKE